jgi:hypothetical protein
VTDTRFIKLHNRKKQKDHKVEVSVHENGGFSVLSHFSIFSPFRFLKRPIYEQEDEQDSVVKLSLKMQKPVC